MNEGQSLRQVPARGVFLAALLFLLAIAIRCQAISFDFVNWDDDLYVVENPAVTTPAAVGLEGHLLTPYLGYPIPVTMATYIIEHALFGLNPAPYHGTNVLLHGLVTLALFSCAMALHSTPKVAFFAALFFTVHPAVVEPVAWVSGRKDLLAGLFSLLALRSYLRPPSLHAALFTAFWSLIAVLSKPTAILLPLLFIALDLLQGRAKGTLKVFLPLSALFALILLATFRFEGQVGAISTPSEPLSLFEHVLASTGRHAGIIFYPYDLLPKYIDPPSGPPLALLIFGAIIILAFTTALFLAISRRHPALYGLLLAAATYLPCSGLIPLSRAHSDSYVYIPLAGLLIAGAAFANTIQKWLLSRLSPPSLGPKLIKWALPLALLFSASVLAAFSIAHSKVYQDGVSLWQALYERYPDSPQVCRNLGNAHLFGRHFEPHLALAIYEHCARTLGMRPFFLKNMAVAAFHAGDLQLAKALFEEVLARDPKNEVARRYLEQIEAKLKRGEGLWTK